MEDERYNRILFELFQYIIIPIFVILVLVDKECKFTLGFSYKEKLDSITVWQTILIQSKFHVWFRYCSEKKYVCLKVNGKLKRISRFECTLQILEVITKY